MALKVRGVAKGGKTATAASPAGTKDKARGKDGLAKLVGNPPPPGVPGCGAFGGALPGAIAFGGGIISSIATATVPTAAAAARSSETILFYDFVNMN